MFNAFKFLGLTSAKTAENRGWNFKKMEFQKVLKTGEMLNMFNLLGYVQQFLKAGEMLNLFNLFNPEGKSGDSTWTISL